MKNFITKRMNIFILLLSMTLISIACVEREGLIANNDKTSSAAIDNGMFNKGKPALAVDFTFTLGRKSKRCQGFGVCEIVFLGLVIIEGPEKPKASIEETERGDFVAKFFLTEGINPPEEDTNLYIDEDMTESYDGYEYTIKAGVYPLDINLGEFGGYLISVERIEL